jgi:hypothetical protein
MERLGRVEVMIEGQPEQDVLKFQMEAVTPIDFKGAPQGQPLFRRLTFVTRVMEGMHDAVSWTVNEPRAPHNLKNGTIKFYSKDGDNYQTMEWAQGFVERADWILPDAEKEEQQRVLMQYQIVARKVSIGGVELVNPWTF